MAAVLPAVDLCAGGAPTLQLSGDYRLGLELATKIRTFSVLQTLRLTDPYQTYKKP